MNTSEQNLNKRLINAIAEARKRIPASMIVVHRSPTPTKSTFNLRDLNRELINNKQ